MYTRALLVVGALLLTPAWSQEPASDASVVTPRTFDLSNDAVKKILRHTAETQYAAVQLTKVEAAEAKPTKTVQYVPPEKPAVTRKEPPLRLPDPAPEESGGLISAIVHTLVAEALDLGPDDISETNTVSWLTCQSRIDLKRETLGQGSCNR
jgi:hypothetical protein